MQYSVLFSRSCVLGLLGALLLAGTAYDLSFQLMSWVLLVRQEQRAPSEADYSPISGGGDERAEETEPRSILGGRNSSYQSSERSRPPGADENDEDLLPPARSNAITPSFLAPDADADDRHQQQQRYRGSLDDPRPPPLSASGDVARQTSINATDEEAGGGGGRTRRPPRPWRHGALGRVLLCFSLPANIGKIFHVAPAKADSEQLDCLHGLRTLCMLWVIWGHTYVFAANYSGASLSLSKLMHRICLQ